MLLIGVACTAVGGWIAMQSTSSRIAYPLLLCGVAIIAVRLLP